MWCWTDIKAVADMKHHTICTSSHHDSTHTNAQVYTYSLIRFHVCSIHSLRNSCSVCVSFSHSLCHAFEMPVNIDFIYLIDIACADIGTLHKQWRNALETPHDERKRGGNKREEHSFLASTLLPCQSTGRRSLSTLELECLSFTHQTICFIRFIFSPSDPAQPDRALMMKCRGHPYIVSKLACTKVRVCVRVCVFVCFRRTMKFQPIFCTDSFARSTSHSHHLCHPKNQHHPLLLTFISQHY